MTIHYATQLYHHPRAETRERMQATLEHNLSLPCISRATVLLEGCSNPWERQGFRAIQLDRHATFADFLALAASSDHGDPQHLLFANSDIRLESSIEQLATSLRNNASVACLTRRELSGSFAAGLDPPQSQDAWMVRCHRIDRLLLEQLAGLRLGVPGCEHLLAATLVAHGYDLWNPCIDCKVVHTDPFPMAHSPSGKRYWGFYAYIPTCRIEDVEHKRPDVIFTLAQKPDRYFAVGVYGS